MFAEYAGAFLPLLRLRLWLWHTMQVEWGHYQPITGPRRSGRANKVRGLSHGMVREKGEAGQLSSYQNVTHLTWGEEQTGLMITGRRGNTGHSTFTHSHKFLPSYSCEYSSQTIVSSSGSVQRTDFQASRQTHWGGWWWWRLEDKTSLTDPLQTLFTWYSPNLDCTVF